ncbi:hypothetical protein JAAARDRAFT_132211 [Jaapia argillacea MUCL 33604]|uniref:Protein kinase domain-containing protein n=1 Tax=Jaapia argillacea MUCL 33604 TaxID=933084 RepID=A0A067PNZ1_9AGAM|nr:hypothetical protein JAAARDRAFT_132211 [Jaapia argillacea MUCL 33604]
MTVSLTHISQATDRFDEEHVFDSDQRSLHYLKTLCGRLGILPSYFTIEKASLEKIEEWPRSNGYFADVYRGRYGSTEVAFKVFRIFYGKPLYQLKRDFCSEAIIWKRLKHDNVLPFLGISTTLFPLCMISPWMFHGSVVEYLEENPSADKPKLLKEIATGIEYLHTKRLVHGDLKGSNILVGKDRSARLADFGLATLAYTSPTLQTATSRSGGTIRWMAPELFQSEQDRDSSRPSFKSDIYALGMVMYEIFTGKLPFFELHHDIAVMGEILHAARPTKPLQLEFSETYWRIMNTCWDSDAVRRPTISNFLTYLNPPSTDDVDSSGMDIPSFLEFSSYVVSMPSRPFSHLLRQLWPSY